jgi:hypothetical protein
LAEIDADTGRAISIQRIEEQASDVQEAYDADDGRGPSQTAD